MNQNVNANVDSNPLNNSEISTYTGVVNLSSHILTDGELSLLTKGLTFVNTPPTPDSIDNKVVPGSARVGFGDAEV